MQEMKYVVTETDDFGKQIFIFPKIINHVDFADILNFVKINGERDYQKPISAGFTNGISCYGESISLNLKSNARDSLLLSGDTYKGK